MSVAIPLETEASRLAVLRAFDILDTPPEPAFDRLTALAAQIFGVPVAVVSLVDRDRQWFKSCHGSSPFPDLKRDSAFCAHAILEHRVFVVEDATKDPRFYDHAQVLGEPGIRFYAGAPLTISSGLNLGTLCLVDYQPREFTEEQRTILAELAACVVDTLQARESRRQLAAQIAHREQAEKQMQSILDNTTSVIYLKDLEGRYLLVNRRFEGIFGHPREHYLGRTDEGLHPPEVARVIRENDVQVMTEGQPIEFEETIVQDDGEHTYISVKFPLRDPHGEVYGICGISTEITERIRAAAALRRSEARKTAVLEAALDGIVTIDHLGNVVEINQAMTRIFGYTAEQMIGHEMAELIVPPEFREAHRHGMRRVLATGQATVLDKRLELPAMRSSGETFPVELTITRIIADGPPLFTGHLRDITDRQEAEKTLRLAKEEAERANAAKSHFLSRMSHELRTPLNAILGFGQVLQRRAQDDWHREKTGFIVDAGRHLLGLINNVLDLTRIETGQTDLATETLDLHQVLDECSVQCGTEATRRAIKIDIAPAPAGAGSVVADRRRVTQVFGNLLSNAIKYNREGGSILISTERRGDEVLVHFRDTGPGIAPEKMARLFVPFDRLDAENQGIEGTGIGLVLARQLVELMGGKVTVESRPGEGSTFSVHLSAASTAPAVEPASAPTAEGAAVVPDLPARARQVVLYAEDNPYNLALMEEIADTHGGVELISVTLGSEVLPRARALKPRLILLDLHLPEVNGDVILREIRADVDLANTPVVVVSADAMKNQIDRLLRDGATEYMTKPIEVTRALDLFDHYLRP